MTSEREARAAARREWPGGLVPHQTEAQLDTPEARVASVWQLTLDAWASAGLSVERRPRADWPGRVLRPR